MKCTHPSWGPSNDGSGRQRCGICGALGHERRYLNVEGESRMPLIPSELLLIVHDPLMGPALLELLRRVKERLHGVALGAKPEVVKAMLKPPRTSIVSQQDPWPPTDPAFIERKFPALPGDPSGVVEAGHQTKSVAPSDGGKS